MITIVNIDEKPRKIGWHQYSLRINELEICRFSHKREDSLSRILNRAIGAVQDIEKRGDPVQLAKERFVVEGITRMIKTGEHRE